MEGEKVALSKREFEVLRDKVTMLENKMRILEEKVKTHEKRLAPQEIYRIVKTEEKAKDIEKQMGFGEKPL
jgi:hypothetical protein